MNLEKIKNFRMDVNLDSYYITIGELLAKYKDNKINLSPNFQRYYKWDKKKKSNLIESILIGIPLPSLFVYEDESLKWQIIDGLQRIATILEFYKKLEGSKIISDLPKIKQIERGLSETDILGDEFKGKTINDFDKCLAPYFIKFKLHIFVIKESGTSDSLKFKLFQRLNTGGEKLNNQEIRNAYIIENKEVLYKSLLIFGNNDSFIKLAKITKSKIEKAKNIELIIRVLILEKYGDNAISYKSINNFIDNNIENFIKEFKYSDLIKFNIVINKLFNDIGINVFHGNKKKSFSEPVYDTIIIGGLKNFDNFLKLDSNKLNEEIKDLKRDKTFLESIGIGPSVMKKAQKSFDRGKLLFI